jgi:hypothetical protein
MDFARRQHLECRRNHLTSEGTISMRKTATWSAILLIAGMVTGPAAWANMCKTETLSCGTSMPVGGYCECSARGKTEDGTVMSRPVSRQPVNATAGGCGANPKAPGCR